MAKRKVNPAESEFYSKLGKKSAAARRKKILEKAKVEKRWQPIGLDEGAPDVVARRLEF